MKPWPQGPPAMASGAPRSASANLSVPLWRPLSCILSVCVLRGHPPPRWNCYDVGRAFREGELCRVCHVFLPLVSLFGISCPCWVWLLVNSVQLCFSYCRWLSCVFIVLSVQLVLVWSTRYSLVFLSVSALSCPALPCLSTLKTVILRISSSPCSLFLPRVCTMTHVFLASLSLLHNASDLCDWQP